MKRKIIQIDTDKCNGCGICAQACHEGAIEMVNGKAQLTREDYCDGLGDCLPACPTEAITFIEKETLAYDEKAVQKNKLHKNSGASAAMHGSCPGKKAQEINRQVSFVMEEKTETTVVPHSELAQWPVQIKLVPVNAPYFEGANLLIAADCCAFAYGNFHNEFMKHKITLIGCPKLDEVDYSEKLTQILLANNIKSVTVVRMEVPCCSKIVNAAVKALQSSGKMIPWQVVTISTEGQILEN